MAATVTVDGVTYRIDYVGSDQLGSHYQAVRLSNGKEEVAASIHRLKTIKGMETFVGPGDGVTHELAKRIADAARQAGLVK